MPASSHPSPAASPLEDDNMLCEILLRLPPDPSALPRASSVCTRWHHLVTDPQFRRRFRLRHRSNPPLPGFFAGSEGLPFLPTLEAPDRVPPECLSLQRDDGDSDWRLLGCRHGHLLIFLHKTDSGGVAKWVLGRSIKLDKLLSLNSEKEYIRIIGFAEHSNMVLLDMFSGLYRIQLDSLHFKELPITKALVKLHHAFESVYAGETSIGGGHDGADLLHNT